MTAFPYFFASAEKLHFFLRECVDEGADVGADEGQELLLAGVLGPFVATSFPAATMKVVLRASPCTTALSFVFVAVFIGVEDLSSSSRS